MTEAQWSLCHDPKQMLLFIRGTASERKLRLLACSCVRQGWEVLEDERGKNALEAAEAFADGKVTKVVLKRIRQAVDEHMREMNSRRKGVWSGDEIRHSEYCVCEGAKRAASEKNYASAIRQMYITIQFSHLRDRATPLPVLFRDIFGPLPFRIVSNAHNWLSWENSTVPRLAQTIYDERNFGLLPILADALEAAGCTNEDILRHCREPGEHVRGCWVVDLLLGKS
jgi:hypothetical protein